MNNNCDFEIMKIKYILFVKKVLVVMGYYKFIQCC